MEVWRMSEAEGAQLESAEWPPMVEQMAALAVSDQVSIEISEINKAP